MDILVSLENSMISGVFIQSDNIVFNNEVLKVRAQERITCCFVALSFRSDLVDLIEQDHRRSLSYSEDTASEERPKVA